MLMMMMMMKRKGSKESLAMAALLLASVNCILPPTKEELSQISLQGERYLDKQIENAINGVKEMKTVMEKSSADHKKFLDDLEKTKNQKEESMRTAKEMEAKMEEAEEVCNDTMRELWEECKPCLKNTCIKYFSRTCSSGSGMVGRQLEDVLNKTSPFSIWINGENIDSLMQQGQRQNREFKDLEQKYKQISDGVDSIFIDSVKVADHSHHQPLMFFMPKFLSPFSRFTRSIPSIFGDRFHTYFSSMMGTGSDFFGSMDTANEGSENEDVVITKPFGNGRMTCREIRRNSAGCLRFREECEKCKEIQHIDCSGKNPLEGPMKKELEEALKLAERFTQHYDSLLKRFEEEMMNTSSILDLLNRQFGWVSSLANNTNDDFFHIHTVNCGEPKEDSEDTNQRGDTSVSVQLFDSPPINFTVSGDLPWTDPKFSEVVAQKALDRYKETSVVVK
ncbi:clusterin isoform X2 [Parambassis ranga]|uniref:Clusterin n=1 Tax=Parambassis ranga TaxID=210632 RepID=A0A6P7HE72_9TELE|nr:clusterin isoform X2 [Parambassis ranga]